MLGTPIYMSQIKFTVQRDYNIERCVEDIEEDTFSKLSNRNVFLSHRLANFLHADPRTAKRLACNGGKK